MDELVKFLPGAQWQQKGHHTSICKDEKLGPVLVKAAGELPSFLKGFRLQAWKMTGHSRVENGAYIVPVFIIEGTPRILNGPSLIPGSPPYHCKDKPIVSGSLYYILASPPGPNLPESHAESWQGRQNQGHGITCKGWTRFMYLTPTCYTMSYWECIMPLMPLQQTGSIANMDSFDAFDVEGYPVYIHIYVLLCRSGAKCGGKIGPWNDDYSYRRPL